VEIGLDILNPVQPKSMDPGKVKRDFGDRLTLWGTVDVQEVLPFGTVADVVREVKLRVCTAGKGGGLILAPAHNIQSEVLRPRLYRLRRPARITWSEAAISPRSKGDAEISAEEHHEKKRKTDSGG